MDPKGQTLSSPLRAVPLVLAAGRGERAGGNKALLDLDGTPALARVIETAAAAKLEPAVVVIGFDAERVRTLIARLPQPSAVVENPDPDRGQTSSVQVGLTAVPKGAEAVLIWPVDHVFVGVDDVLAIVDGARLHPEATVVLPSHDGWAGHPALLRRTLFAAIRDLQADEPLHTVVRGERQRTHFVERPSDAVLRDLDTPQDIAAARADVRLKGRSPAP
jgi:CTP:molybdopterin cytidylyltransferase MocA